jgi:hypothetical protein
VNISTDPWIWIAAIGSIAIFSSLFKDNPLYRACEHVFVGSGAGYALSQAYRNIVIQGWQPMVNDGRTVLIIPLILGVLLYARFFRGIAWLSRWSMAFLIGIGTGISIYGVYNSQLLAQIKATMVPLSSFDNIVMVVGVVSVLLYFLFTIPVKGPFKHVTSFGRWMMMVTFGVSFGNVVMGRISLLLGVLETVYGKWLGLL